MRRYSPERDVTEMLGRLLADMRTIDDSSVLDKELFEYLIIKTHCVVSAVYIGRFVPRGMSGRHMTGRLAGSSQISRTTGITVRSDGESRRESAGVRHIVTIAVMMQKMNLFKPFWLWEYKRVERRTML